jgi:CDGSH-type Zn-finger protein
MKRDSSNPRKPARYRIKVSRDGPYLVSGGVPLLDQIVCNGDDGGPEGWEEGGCYPAGDRYALCRCGQSQRMPFCDGSHGRVRFDGTETAVDTPYLDQAEHFAGPGLTLTDARVFCMGAGFCHRAGGTWALTKKSGDAKAKQTAIEEACDCPSGRLVAWGKDGRVIEPEFEPSIGVVEDCEGRKLGPLWVKGGIPVESADGRAYEVRNRMTLCSCGRSSNKPFCDGSHEA